MLCPSLTDPAWCLYDRHGRAIVHPAGRALPRPADGWLGDIMSTPRTTDQAPSTASPVPTAADIHTIVTSQGIRTVEPLIRPYVRQTPAITIDRADFGLPSGPLVLKLEHLQHSGSFKARGAFANLLLRDIPGAGVVAASGGNHGVAVSYAARALGVPARIYVPGI